MVRTKTKKKATVEDYMKLPEGANYQLIEGEIVEWYSQEKNKMASPKIIHQDMVGEIYRLIANYLAINKIGRVFIAPTDVHLSDENIYQPDILFVTNKKSNIINETAIYGTPDLIIEVISTGTKQYDLKIKMRNYEKNGVLEYYIIDPEDKEVIAYYLVQGKFKEHYRELGYIDSKILDKRFDF